MLTIDCDLSTDCLLGVEPCDACAQERLEQEIDQTMFDAEE